MPTMIAVIPIAIAMLEFRGRGALEAETVPAHTLVRDCLGNVQSSQEGSTGCRSLAANRASWILHGHGGSRPRLTITAAARSIAKGAFEKDVGRPNAPMESFFTTLKVERIYRVRYETRAQARLDIVDWIEGWYNRQCLHSANGFLAPVAWANARLAA